MYNILIDRFARGNSEPWLDKDYLEPVFCGGNLQGVIDRLPYLQDLGINTILLTPFHPTTVYHGYHVLDFYGVDPRFGSIETIKALLHEAHKRHIRVIMDFVPNHVSHTHPFFLDAQANPKSRYRNWFLFTKWPKEYISFLDFYEVPKLDLANPEVKAHVLGAAVYWTDLGFDGLRLDHVLGVPHSFLQELRTVIKQRNPNCLLIGEATIGRLTWDDLKTLRVRNKLFMYMLSHLRINTNFLFQLQYRKDLDGVFDFFFRDMAVSFVVNRVWYRPAWLLGLILKFHYFFYHENFLPIPLLDNIDLDRFPFQLQGDKTQIKVAAKLLFEQPQPVMILYGNEAGLGQSEGRGDFAVGHIPHGDLEIRGLMPWRAVDPDLFATYQNLIKNHKERIIR